MYARACERGSECEYVCPPAGVCGPLCLCVCTYVCVCLRECVFLMFARVCVFDDTHSR